MAEIPKHWTRKTVGEVCSLSGGGTPSTKVAEYWDGDVPWLTPSEVTRTSGLYISDTDRKLSSDGLGASNALLLPPGTVLMTSRATIAEVVINTVPMATNQGFINLRCDGTLFNEFLAYWIMRNKPLIQSNAAGSTFREISKGSFRNLKMALPPLAEQKAIAKALGAVQRARDARKREIELERERKAALMDYLFTHGTRNEPTKMTEIGEIPESWEVVRLEQCARVQTGVAKGRVLRNGPTVDLPYLRVANVQDGYLDLEEVKTITLAERELDRYRLRVYDVVLTEGGDFDKLGRGFLWKGEIPVCVHQNHIYAVRVDRKRLVPEFMAYQFGSSYGKRYFLSVAHKTTNLACINTSKLRAFPVLIPELHEQEQMASALTACDTKIAALEKEAALLDELFRAMLEELMTGRLSAVPLIERISGTEPRGGPRGKQLLTPAFLGETDG